MSHPFGRQPGDFGRQPDQPVTVQRFFGEPTPPVRCCRVCGCSEFDACLDLETGDTCHWVEWDLCSACVTSRLRWERVLVGGCAALLILIVALIFLLPR